MYKSVSVLSLVFVFSLTTQSAGQTRLVYPNGQAGQQRPCAPGENCPVEPLPGQTQRPETPKVPRPCPAGANCPLDSGTGEESATEPADQVRARRTPDGRMMPRLAADQEAPNEFQSFVTSSTGRWLSMYGYNLFTDVPTTFAPVDRVPVTADYVLGPGDEVLVRAWGQIDLDARVVVDRAGDIYLPKVGSIQVAGLKFAQLTDYLKTAVGRVFRNFDLTANLGQLRSIQVFVVGQARRPGAYTVSSLSTLVNALFASGGPSSRGSMRHIQVKRNNQVVTDFDMYDLLLNGDKSKDVVLLPGDVIYIPPIGPLVAVAGSVNVPAIYELGSTHTLGEVLDWAGGLTVVADGQKASVERVYDRSLRRVEEFALDTEGRGRTLQGGDLVRIIPLSPRFDKTVTLRGNVALPSRYPWFPGMRVRDLIPSREFLITRDYWDQQNGAIDSWNGQKKMQESSEQRSESLRRQATGEEKVAEKLGPGKDLRRVPEINWGYAVVYRMGPNDLSTRLLPFDLGKAIDDPNSTENLELQSGDVITVFSQADLRVAVHDQSKFVYLEGEFHAAGMYRADPGETLRHLVTRIGGLTPEAYLYGAVFTRESTRAEQRKNLDEIINRMEKDLQHGTTELASKAVAPEELATAQTNLANQKAVLEKLKQVQPVGRIVLEVRPGEKNAAALPELVLEDGDRLYVPSRQATVSVAGEVFNSGTFIYSERKRLSDYLRQAGGATRYGDQSNTFLLRADGSVVAKKSRDSMWSHSFESLRPMPGDTVVVPQQLPKFGFMRELKDWTQIFSQLALGAAAIQVLK